MSDPDGLREAIEDALFDNPDDLAAHHAYADLLCEQGDPRGEFIQVQLALEDPARPPEERRRLRAREAELLAAHEREWLGELAPLLLATPDQRHALFAAEWRRPDQPRANYADEAMGFRHTWARGWLGRFECHDLTVEMARTLGRAFIAQMLHTLVYRGGERAGVFRYAHGPDLPHREGWDFLPVELLAHHPAVRNLRVFQFGTEADPALDVYQDGTKFRTLAPLVEAMPRLEELHVFGHNNTGDWGLADLSRLASSFTLYNLRVFRHFHGHAYPLEALAANPALARLTHLQCFPHSFAREYDFHTGEYGELPINRHNVRAVLTSPHLNSLTHLQLRCCSGGDATLADVVASGVLKRLKVLDLRHGHVTDEGARLLAGCPDARRLELLDLTNNRLTGAGAALLRGTVRRFVGDGQQTAPYDDETILYYGDSE